MKWKYKAVMFLTLLIFCVGSVCAADPDNSTGDGGLNPVNPPINNVTDNQNVINEVNIIINQALEKKDLEIKALQDNDIKQSNEIQQLKENNTQLDKRVKALEESNNQLNNTVNNQSVIINSLKADNKVLTDSNKVLTDSNKVLTDRVQAELNL